MKRIIHILLVEDDNLDAMDLKRSLDKIGLLYMLEIAKNGEEAIRILERKHTEAGAATDLIILDLNMPKMNGFEFLQILRGDERWRDTKVFVLTTSSENEDRRAVSGYGISGYIVKPLKLNNVGSIDAFNLMIDLMNM